MIGKPRSTSIRANLLIGFVGMALLPAMAIAAGSSLVGYYNGRQQALDRLQSVAALEELEINTWLQALQSELTTTANEEYGLERVQVVLDLARDNKYLNAYNKVTRNWLGRLVADIQHYDELFLLDLRGQVALSTDAGHEGDSHAGEAYFVHGLEGPTVVPQFCAGSAIVAVPIHHRNGELLGVLAGRASLAPLAQILRGRTGLGTTGKSYLADSTGILLSADSACGFPAPAGPDSGKVPGDVEAAIASHSSGAGVYDGFRDVSVVGVYRWLPGLQATLLVEQDTAEAFQAMGASLAVNLGVALAAVLLAVGAALLISRQIARPIVGLAMAAARIATGDLGHEATIDRADEIGVLAGAFNSMTAQLRELIDGLEDRVEERTQALQRRALELETSARVSREITSILDIDDLMARVTALIRDAFGYYYIQIFLVDRTSGALVGRAASGPPGPQDLRLPLRGNSLNARAAETREAVLVNDVSQDSRFLADEHLPETRSELVIPLRAGDNVIGTLDLQRAEKDAFGPEEVLVLQSLGDQIAVAIENARLYDRSRALAVVEERNRLARELHDSVTQSLYGLVVFAGAAREVIEAGDGQRARQHLSRIEGAAQKALKEMRLLLYELRPPTLAEEGLVGALQQRLNAVEDRTGLQVRLLVDGEIDLPAPVEEGLYRIAQEALNNALRHAGAGSVTVRLQADAERLELVVEDDGCGFDVAAAADRGGLGLASMRERARALGSQLEIQSRPGAGTTVKVRAAREEGL
ncbi:MAG: GAF domain-containing protein [Anaerolineae bacterium]|nr:GAF domain-containing protein [Anaerolineae bacterium]